MPNSAGEGVIAGAFKHDRGEIQAGDVYAAYQAAFGSTLWNVGWYAGSWGAGEDVFQSPVSLGLVKLGASPNKGAIPD